MVKRELYIDKIRPLIDKDIIKVITGLEGVENPIF